MNVWKACVSHCCMGSHHLMEMCWLRVRNSVSRSLVSKGGREWMVWLLVSVRKMGSGGSRSKLRRARSREWKCGLSLSLARRWGCSLEVGRRMYPWVWKRV